MEEVIQLFKINQGQVNMNPKSNYLKNLAMFLVKIQESDNMKLKFQDQAHMNMKQQSLNMAVKNSQVMDLAQDQNLKTLI